MKMIQATILPFIFFLITACQSSSADVIELCMSTQPNLSEKECECIDTVAQEELTDEEYTALKSMMKDYEKDSRRKNGSASGEKNENNLEKDYSQHMLTLVAFLKNVENKCREK